MSEQLLAGRYLLGDLIGQGGMAKVYRGTDVTLERDVAVKILNQDLAKDASFRNRFRLEAQAASRMSNPSIVRVYDAGEDASGPEGPVPYIVMELVTGRLLKDIMAQGPVPVSDAVHYVDGILDALDYSHRAGVVHRDIKPGNVMITDSGQVKVMDFGIARAVSDSSSTVAETTQIIGTAAYFSPEQAKGEPVDARADVYSAGVVLYELLAGRQPFRGESPVAVAYQHVSEAPIPPSEVNENSPQALDPVVLRALAKDPFQRYPDAASFQRALDDGLSGRAPSKRQIGSLTSELYGPNPRQAQETARALRQLSADTTMSRTQSGPPVAWIWSGVVIVAVLLAAVLFWVLQLRDSTDAIEPANNVVPNLIGMTREAAEAELTERAIEYIVHEEPDPTVDEGLIIRTAPTEGTSLAEGDTVDLYVSTGVETSLVPALIGSPQAVAEAALQEVGLVPGSVRQRNHPSSPAGTVLSADAAEGAEVPRGTVVNFEVASGQVTLRDLGGWSLEAATAELESLGLTVTVVPLQECPALSPSQVQSMSVAPGDVPIHSEVGLRVCDG